MAVNKLDPKIIFASEAPAQDTPAVFNNRTLGWGESRKNGGRPTIKQMNALQQDTELKILWLNENSVTPFDATIDYPINAVTIKDDQFKIFNGTSWNLFLDKSSVGLNNVDNTSDLNKPISTAVKAKLDYIDNNGAALPYKDGVTYEENAVVVKDGVLQQWKGGVWVIVNKTNHNELLGRDAADSHPVSAISYGSINQESHNDGLESIAEMLAIASPKTRMRVFVKSYHSGIGLGGGEFVYDSTKASVNDGVNIFNGWVRQSVPQYLNLQNAGAIGDGVANDYAAFKRIENIITSNANNNTGLLKWVVHFPQPSVHYSVEYQEFVAGVGFKLKHLFSIDYRDLGRENGDWQNDRYDNVEIMLKSDNAVIKLKDGYYCGTFNKNTKEIINTVSPFEPGDAQWEQYKDVYTVASAGQLLNFTHIKTCVITGNLTLDGNRDSCVVGGRWGDTGWQTSSYGLVVNSCENASVSGVVAKNHCTDGLYFCGRQLADQNLLSEDYTLFVDNCVSFNNSRNSMAITGGTNVIFTNCVFDRAGLPDHPIASQPKAAVDIEAESFAIRDLTFTNCYFGDSGFASCSTYAGDISGVNFNNCKFVNQYNYALRNYSPYIKYNNCTILGGVAQSYMGGDLAARTQYIDCEISDYVTANTDSSVLYVLDIYGGNIVIRNTTVNSKTVDLIYNDSNNNKTQSEFIDSTFNVGNVQSQNSWITGLLRNVVINDKRVNKSERYVIQMLNARVSGAKILSATGSSGIELWSNRDFTQNDVVSYSQSNPYDVSTVPLFNLVCAQPPSDTVSPQALKKVAYADNFSLLSIQYNVGDTIFCTNPALLIDRWICTVAGVGSASTWKKIPLVLQDL